MTMRSLLESSGIALLLACAGTLSADTTPYEAVVVADEVEVRCAPGTKADFYPTNKLRKGDTVTVLKKVDADWLAIKPPPGSFSWIDTRLVKELEKGTWEVIVDEAPGLIGSELRKMMPTQTGAKLLQGTKVVSIGSPKSTDRGQWLPIESPKGEVRFVPAKAAKWIAPEKDHGPKPA